MLSWHSVACRSGLPKEPVFISFLLPHHLRPCEQVLQSPCGPYNGLAVPDGHQLCAVDIVRSGGILLEAVRKAG